MNKLDLQQYFFNEIVKYSNTHYKFKVVSERSIHENLKLLSFTEDTLSFTNINNELVGVAKNVIKEIYNNIKDLELVIILGCENVYIDTDNITQYSTMISNHIKEQIKLQLNSLYGTQEERYIKNQHKILDDTIKKNNEFKVQMFKLDIIKLMIEYNLSISHEDSHGAFIIDDYKQENAEWFLDAEYK